MAVKKSELYSSLWKSCDELRGGMDASQYKDYILVLLFVKYVSDKYAGEVFAPVKVPDGGSFADMSEAKGKTDIGERMNVIIDKLADANRLKGVINTADFDDSAKLGDGKEMQERLTNLVAIFENPALDFSRNRAGDDDLLGDAYEYLMRNFATQSGKSKGQFYTPAEVSRIMAKIIGLEHVKSAETTIYDPTCGSGSLLLKAADEVPPEVGGITIYGQEKDVSTRALAKMNMILHGHPTATIEQGNTLANPLFKKKDGSLQTFEYAVANPPFSDKAWSNGFNPAEDEFDRFIAGIPPQKNGDYAYFQHLIASLKSTGKGAIILPHGVLFRGNVEGEIRKNIIERGYIKGIIGLPANLFYGTGIPACIIVVDKENASARRGIFMIDASKGFVKDGNKNRLRHQDIHKIVDVFNNQIEVPRYSKMVTRAEIVANEFNLNIPRYIDSTEAEDIQDIEAHLLGGIPNRDVTELKQFWDVFPTMKEELFEPKREGYSDLSVELNAIKTAILEHDEFLAYREQINAVFAAWQAANMPRLKGIQVDDTAKDLIEIIAEDLLEQFYKKPLIDKYDVYQHLMSYWAEMMQDDVYMLVDEGWTEANKLRQLLKVKVKGKKTPQYTEEHDFEVAKKRYKADLIPPALVIARYFAEEQAEVDALQADLEAASQQMQELEEEHGGEDGLLNEAKADSGNLTKGSIKARLKELDPNDPDDAEEIAMIEQYQGLMDEESKVKNAIKGAEAKLYTALIKQYPTLSEDEIKVLVVEDKWLAAIEADVQGELERVSQALTGRIKQLAERYANTLPELAARAEKHRKNVEAHLKRMGYSWKQ